MDPMFLLNNKIPSWFLYIKSPYFYFGTYDVKTQIHMLTAQWC